MNPSTGPEWKLALPSIWRRYHWPRVSPTMSLLVNFSAPSGKCPQKITALVHTLRITLAARLAVAVLRAASGDRVRAPTTAGYTT